MLRPFFLHWEGIRSAVRTRVSAYRASGADWLALKHQRYLEVADKIVVALEVVNHTPALSVARNQGRQLICVEKFDPPSWHAPFIGAGRGNLTIACLAAHCHSTGRRGTGRPPNATLVYMGIQGVLEEVVQQALNRCTRCWNNLMRIAYSCIKAKVEHGQADNIAEIGQEVWQPEGTTVLGTPIGSDRHTSTKTDERIAKERRQWDAIPSVADLKCVLQIFLQSANPCADIYGWERLQSSLLPKEANSNKQKGDDEVKTCCDGDVGSLQTRVKHKHGCLESVFFQ